MTPWETMERIEHFFLRSPMEIEIRSLKKSDELTEQAVLTCFSSEKYYFGKGLNSVEAQIGACLEFVERRLGGLLLDDKLIEATYGSVVSQARDPEAFSPAYGKFKKNRTIDWVWGYSLTEKESVLVPANLVFFPYEVQNREKYIAWDDSNGLAAATVLEDAILHGLLEIIERDAVMISEYNRLPLVDLSLDSLSGEIKVLLDRLKMKGFRFTAKKLTIDHSLHVVLFFLRHKNEKANCSVAFGCHLDPVLAISRAVTEAIQLLPPSAGHEEWLLSDFPQRYEAASETTISIENLPDLSSDDQLMNIERCTKELRKIGAEVIVVDLSVPDTPFAVVRVLATGLQPILREGDRRVSRRFFDFAKKSQEKDLYSFTTAGEIKIEPLVGYGIG